MGVTYTRTNNNIYIVPDDDTSDDAAVNEFVITSASPTQISFEYFGGDWWISSDLEGEFSIQGNIVGMGLGDASSLVSGVLTKQVDETPDDSGEGITLSTWTWDPGHQWQTISGVSWTEQRLSYLFSGDDLIYGDEEIVRQDVAYSYGGDDRFIMTYGDEYAERFYGGTGSDTAIIESSMDYWNISYSDTAYDASTGQSDLSGFYISDTRYRDDPGSPFGSYGHILQVVDVEFVQFTDALVGLDAGGQTYNVINTDTFDQILRMPTSEDSSASNNADSINDGSGVVGNDGDSTTDAETPLDQSTSDLAEGVYSLEIVADVFGTILYLDGLIETKSLTGHTIKYNGDIFDYDEVDPIIMTVSRDRSFTDEFAQEISAQYPSAAGISYQTAYSLVGVSNWQSTILAVAGADGNYVG